MQALSEKYFPLLEAYLPTILGALAVLIVGWLFICMLESLLKKAFDKRRIDPSLTVFLSSLIGAILKVVLVISVLSMLGLKTTSFIAILGAAGLAIGLAFQGTLSNFAGSTLILFFKPFKVGDVIDVNGLVGTVKEIQLFSTVIRTFDNRRVIIPNGGLSTGTIINLSSETTRRIDLIFGVSYNDDIDKVKAILKEIVNSDSRVLKEPASEVVLGGLADNSVNFFVRPWAKSEDYWPLYFDLLERVKKAFDDNGITIPYPQRDMHIYHHGKKDSNKSDQSLV